MKNENSKSAIDMKDPMVSYIVAHPKDTFVLANNEDGWNDPVQKAVFGKWCDYLHDKNQHVKLKVWRWMRGGGTKHITLPCADPAQFDRSWRPSGRLRAMYGQKDDAK